MSTVPTVPPDGYWQEKGHRYATLQIAREVFGVNHPGRYIKDRPQGGQGAHHPSISRHIGAIRRPFILPPNRIVFLTLFLVEDLAAIRDARQQIKTANHDPYPHATAVEAAKDCGRSEKTIRNLAAKKLIGSQNDPRGRVVRQRGRHGRKVSYAKHRNVLTVRPADLQVLTTKPQNKISLSKAASESGIPYETWYWWTTLNICPPLGKRLFRTRELAPTIDGKRLRETWHIGTGDFASILSYKEGLEPASRPSPATGDTPAPARAVPQSETPDSGAGIDGAVTPRWDKELGKLFVGEQVVLCFQKKRAPDQELVLHSFQELKWAQRIDDPLDTGKLHFVLHRLNVKLRGSGLSFHTDGKGKGICWLVGKEDN